ncbi:MAG: S-layer homology domain-containing protein [Sedimentibacter sp.]|uniref:S-layer homology domain-containing protein n=1 Tax=Sedimentibacter sp. TaxID=1960295 RepID=UPI003158EA80
MKKIIAAAICLCFVLSAASTAYAATDYKTAEQTVIALGIMTGDGSGNLNLSNSVTRAEFAKMLVSASVYRDTVEDSSGFSPFKDVKYSHWASDYIRTAVDEGWMLGYSDGTFRPDNTITYEEAASAVLKILGYESSDLKGTYPGAQISKFKSLKLNSGTALVQGCVLTRNECMYIFYNLMGAVDKNGAVYGTTLGYTVNSNGEIDYSDLLKKDIEGPYVVKDINLSLILPFDISGASVYRNGKISSDKSAAQCDVIYYNTNTNTVWIYSERIVGTYTAASPGTFAPDTITVAGNSYSLGTSAAKLKVSSSGEFSIGDTVALLMGMDGDVVDVVEYGDVDSSNYGVVVSDSRLSTYSLNSSSSKADYVVSVACTDGVVREYPVTNNYYKTGNVVTVSNTKGELTVTKTGAKSLSGTISSTGAKLGGYAFADDIKILDVADDGEWSVVYPSRLYGAKIQSDNVSYYVLNDNKEISHLILKDVTGDMYSYGLITDAEKSETTSLGEDLLMSGTYKYIVNDVSGVLSTTNKLYNVSRGAAVFYYTNGQITGMRNLSSTALNEVSALLASGENRTYKVSENVQVYLRSSETSSEFSLTQLSAINTGSYTLTGYYDTLYPAGGRIRVIVAVEK